MRELAFRTAGILWLLLGIAAILTIFGTLIGIALAVLVGIRRSAIAARFGSAVGLLLLLPGQVILEMAGCDQQPCGAQPYLLAYGLPALVVTLNGIAGWAGGAPDGAEAAAPGSAGSRADRGRARPEPGPETDVAPGQQSLWSRRQD